MVPPAEKAGSAPHATPARRPQRLTAKQAGAANCGRLPREIAAAPWQAEMVNGGADMRFADFKRLFEASLKPPRQIPAAFGLTGAAAMLIKSAGNRKA